VLLTIDTARSVGVYCARSKVSGATGARGTGRNPAVARLLSGSKVPMGYVICAAFVLLGLDVTSKT
jgi:hypothetical protein